MNKIGVSFISGAIGLAVGAIGSYIFFKKKYESKYYEAVSKAIDEECDRLRNDHKETATEVKIWGRPNPTVEDVDQDEYRKRIDEIVKAMDDRVEDIESDPCLIDEDEFRFLPPEYEIRQLQYLRDDGTVLDENDEIVTEPGIYISKFEDHIKSLPDQACTYILWESMKISVEVVVLDGSYQSIFLGG